MADPALLRKYATQCIERAESGKDPQARAAWLEMAANWLNIAATQERSLGGQYQQQQQQIQPKRDKA
jgi:hypothetical protein